MGIDRHFLENMILIVTIFRQTTLSDPLLLARLSLEHVVMGRSRTAQGHVRAIE